MNRDRALKIVLVVVGVLFIATIYPLTMFLARAPALAMMLSLYSTLGIFLLLAVRNPSAHRSLIGFTAWSSLAHAAGWVYGRIMAVRDICRREVDTARYDESALDAARRQRRALAAEMLKAVDESEIGKNIATEKQFEVLVARYDQAQKARAAKRAADVRATALAIQDLDTQRVGALLAVAAAWAWDVPAGDTSLTSLSKIGLWVTPGYRLVRCTGTGADQSCSTSVDLLGVVRYLDNRRSIDADAVWEFGARGIWQARAKLALSAEWLGRSGDDDPGSRIVGVAEYAVTDSVFLYASFGRDFEERGVRHNLVSTIGLTFGLGKRPIVN
jgi:hypothetical protein